MFLLFLPRFLVQRAFEIYDVCQFNGTVNMCDFLLLLITTELKEKRELICLEILSSVDFFF